ncbi:MAG TPA: hypothetical protein VKS21_08340, partial [Spirochaetota bacterium]|nr:hypothetical protein [Spirochaetota bacterium]
FIFLLLHNLPGLDSANLASIGFQYGVPFKFRHVYDSNAPNNMRNKTLTTFSFPFTVFIDFGNMLRFNRHHSLLNMFNISYDSMPVNAVFDLGTATKFFEMDPTQEFLSAFYSAKHTWYIKDFLILNSSANYNALLNGNGSGNFKIYSANNHSVGADFKLTFFKPGRSITKLNHIKFFKDITATVEATYNFFIYPNSSDMQIPDITTTNTATNTLDISDGVDIADNQNYNNLLIGFIFNYTPMPNLSFMLDYRFDSDLYYDFVDDYNDIQSNDQNVRDKRNMFLFSGQYNALYQGRGRYLLEFSLTTDLRGNNSSRTKLQGPVVESTISNLPADQIIKTYSEIYGSNTNSGSSISTNTTTNTYVLFPDYFDYISFVMEPVVRLNLTRRFSMYLQYTLSYRRYKGRYAKYSDQHPDYPATYKKSKVKELRNIINYGLVFKNHSGHRYIKPFVAFQFINSNDDAKEYDIYYAGIKSVYEF